MQYQKPGDALLCMFDLCVYNKGYECQLERVEINDFGMCRFAKPVLVDANYLEAKKECQRIEQKTG